MNKNKIDLISLIVISTVFCISIIFNIQLPFYNVKDSIASTNNSKEAVIHSFSYNVNQANIFSVDQYLSSNEVQLSNDNSGDDQSGSLTAQAASTAVPPDAVPTDGASALNESAEGQPQALMMATADTDTASTNPEASARDNESVAATEVAEEQPEAKYADIGISIAKEYVNIREEASTESKVLGKLYRNSACTIISTEGDWYYIESGSVTGYAKSEFIKTGMPDDELIKNYSSMKISVDVDGLNVRIEPSTESKKLTVVYQNERYPVLEQNGDWIKIHIEDENLDGYVKSEFADLIVAFTEAVSKEEEEKILQLQAVARAKAETVVKYGDGFSYTDEDLILLACLVHSEAGTQSYEGKLAVANVVLNRVKSSKYPDNIRDVIYQPGQFSVAASGSLQKQLDNFDNYDSTSQKLSIKAAKDALEGANNIGTRLYFHMYELAEKKGYTAKKESVKLGEHLFW